MSLEAVRIGTFPRRTCLSIEEKYCPFKTRAFSALNPLGDFKVVLRQLQGFGGASF